MKIILLNIRGLAKKSQTTKNKYNYIKTLQNTYLPDIIILTETNNPNTLYNFHEHFIISSDPNIHQGQGIMIIRTPTSDWEISNQNNCYPGRKLDITIKNTQNNETFFISSLYLDASKNAKLNEQILNSSSTAPQIVVGDFNCPLSAKDTTNRPPTNTTTKIIKSFITKHNLIDVGEYTNLTAHTYFSPNNQSSRLDLILCDKSIKHQIDNFQIINTPEFLDHKALFLEINKKPKPCKRWKLHTGMLKDKQWRNKIDIELNNIIQFIKTSNDDTEETSNQPTPDKLWLNIKKRIQSSLKQLQKKYLYQINKEEKLFKTLSNLPSPNDQYFEIQKKITQRANILTKIIEKKTLPPRHQQ